MTTRRLAIAGAAAVVLALGVTELLAGVLTGGPSPLVALGQQVVGVLPGGVLNFAIETFGTANRRVLAVVSVVVATAIGAGVGIGSRTSMSPAVIAFVAAAGLAFVASLGQPGASAPVTAAVLVVGAACGLALLARLRQDLSPATDVGRVASDADEVDRRRFLRLAAGGVVLGAVGGIIGRWVPGDGAGPPVDPAGVTLPPVDRPLPAVPTSADLSRQLPGVSPLFTPNDAFFRIDTAFAAPRVDAAGWSMRVTGLVERELVLDHEELLSRPMREVDTTIACVSNEVGGDLVGNARWLGVPLRELIEEAGPTPEAEQVLGRSVDGWTGGFPLELALDGREALVAVAMNGEPLPVEHGFPARLVVPGLYGYVSATKWLAEVELTTWDVDGYWVPRGWSKRAPAKTASRIDVPAGNETLPAGEIVVAGVAWAPTRGIARVEVRADDGAWQEAELLDALSPDTWVQWRLPITMAEGSHDLTVRATDGQGDLQSEGPRPPAPDGAEGWHTIRISST